MKKEDKIMKYNEDFYYIVFILGSDLLKDVLYYNDGMDSCFEYCKSIAENFMNSDYNKCNKSMYECLEEYVKEVIKNDK